MIGERATWGRGCATAAVRIRSWHAFLKFGLHRIDGRAINPATRRTYKKCGCRHEGAARRKVHRNGIWHDVEYYGILRDDWEANGSSRPVPGPASRRPRLMPLIPDTYTTLSAMITPALFMTACGSLIISTSNRMARVVDRVRLLNLEADALCRGATELDFVDERLDHASSQLDRMMARSDLTRHALTLLYIAMLAFVGTSLTMAVDALIGNYLIAVPTTLAITGVSLMFAGCVQLTREAHMALRGNRAEIYFYQNLRARRGRPPTLEKPAADG